MEATTGGGGGALKILFAGSPDFAARHLQSLLNSRHRVVAVLTQPDRRAGRGRRSRASPVKDCALERGLPVLQPAHLKTPAVQAELAAFGADALVVVAYGLLLPRAVLSIPPLGCLNVHASLLPRWRGATPIQHALMAGDSRTGLSFTQMDSGLDTGPVFETHALTIAPQDTGESLSNRLATLGAEALPGFLDRLGAGARSHPQAAEGVTLAPKLTKADAEIDFSLPALHIERRIRALLPWPVAASSIAGTRVRIFAARVLTGDSAAPPGTLLEAPKGEIRVACGRDALALECLQMPGGKVLPAAELSKAGNFPLRPGARLAPDASATGGSPAHRQS